MKSIKLKFSIDTNKMLERHESKMQTRKKMLTPVDEVLLYTIALTRVAKTSTNVMTTRE